MLAKKQLADAIAALPDSLTIEEAVERLYQAFKRRQRASQSPRPVRRPGSARGLLRISPDFDAPLADFTDYQ